MDYIHSLRVSFPFYLFVPFVFVWFQSVVTYHPAPTFVNHLVRYSLSLIYKGIRLYARVTNLGPEGKQTLQ
jgi:hypothetical protein